MKRSEACEKERVNYCGLWLVSEEFIEKSNPIRRSRRRRKRRGRSRMRRCRRRRTMRRRRTHNNEIEEDDKGQGDRV